jgi:hypothetical protein
MVEQKKVAKKKPFNGISIKFDKPLIVEHANQSSVDLKRNSKGITEFSVKVYGSNPVTAAQEASKIYDSLNDEYPN